MKQTLLDVLADQHGGKKELAEKAGVTVGAFQQVKRGNNIVGYTYNLAERLNSTFTLQIIENGHLVTIKREKI